MVIRTSLDWFQVSFCGEVSEEVVETLHTLKTKAQDKNTPEPYTVGLIEFLVMDKGRGLFTYQLKHPEFEIYLSPKAAKGSPNASIRLSAFGLSNSEPQLLWEIACACLDNLGSFSPLALTRVDVAADFQGWEPTPLDMAGIVCGASYRATHGTEEAVQTFQYGKGAVVLRVYDKTAEIVAKGRTWMCDVWALTGRYNPTLPVWRAEVQLRNEALKELGILSPGQVLADPAALLGYGLSWAQLRVRTDDSTKKRWPEDPRWTALRKGVHDGPAMNRQARLCDLMSLERVKTALLGLLATAAAYYEIDDFWETARRLLFSLEVHMMTNGIDFPTLVETKRRRILGRL